MILIKTIQMYILEKCNKFLTEKPIFIHCYILSKMYLRTKKYFNIYCFQYRHVFSTEIFAPRYDPIQEVERRKIHVFDYIPRMWKNICSGPYTYSVYFSKLHLSYTGIDTPNGT